MTLSKQGEGGISIHAPRVGSDRGNVLKLSIIHYFYPRSPRGERHIAYRAKMDDIRISIHAPRVGSDRVASYHKTTSGIISIHAPRVGSDGQPLNFSYGGEYFYPRSPRGERLRFLRIDQTDSLFLSTLPAWGATIISWLISPIYLISIHAPRVGSDPFHGLTATREAVFLSTLPAWGATISRMASTLITQHFYPRSPRGERP